jgi:sugar phosphate isomerase/epimerase
MDVTTVSVKAFPDWSDAEAKRAKRWLDDNGLRIGEVIPFYNGRHLGFHDREPHKTALESYSKQIHTSAILGAHCVGFGWSKEFGWPSPDIWPKKTWNERIAGVADLAEVAEREGVDIAAHPLYFTPLKSVERCKDLIGSVGSPRLKILLDLVNMCEPYMYHSTTDLVNQAFDELGEHIVSMHAKDVKISGGGIGGGAKSEKGNPIVHIDEAVPGTGVMDYPTIMKRLGELPQEITLHVEHFEYEDAIAGQQYIRSVARQVGVKVR